MNVDRKGLLASSNPQYSQDLPRLLTGNEFAAYIDSFAGVIERERKLHSKYPSREKPSGWQTTDPQNHSSGNFRYIVHAIINTLDNDYIASLRGLPERNYKYRRWNSLSGFLAREMISCTLVDEVHRGTYDQRKGVFHGFILNVPEENIVAIAPGDMLKPTEAWSNGEPTYSREEREKFTYVKAGINLKKSTPSAQDFLRGVNFNYNELAVDGIGPSGRKVRIEGIFLTTDPVLEVPLYELYTRFHFSPRELYKRFINPDFGFEEVRWNIPEMKKRYQEAKDLAKILELPLIHIPIPLSV